MNRILIVDDEQGLLDVAREFLKTMGDFDLDTCLGASDALKEMQTTKYDAIISDYQMPFMNGIEFLKVLRKRGDRIPFILFTGRGREEIAIEALNSGADFYVNKGGEPWAQFAELGNMVTQAIARRRAEEALINSERYFKALIENSSDVIAVLSMDGTIEYVSPSIRQVMGYEPEDVMRLSIMRFAPPDMGEEKAKEIFGRLARKESPSIELWIVDSKGRKRDLEVIGNLYQEGDVPHVVVHVRDISERKRSELALRISEERFRCTFDQSPIGAAMVGMDFRFLRVNEAFTRLLGYSEEELRSLTFKEITHPDDLGKDILGIGQLTKGEIDQYSAEKRYLRKDGGVVNARVTVRLIKDALGSPIHFLPMVEDITSQKRAEIALRESQKFLDNIIENIPDMILVKDAKELRYVLVNRAVEELLGRPRTELIGRIDLDLFPKAEAEFFVEKDREALDQRGLVDIPLETVLTKEKGKRFLHTKKIPILGDDDEPLYLLGISEDVTQSKAAADELAESEQRYHHLFEKISNGVAIYEARDGGDDFVIKDLNPAGQRLSHVRLEGIRGRSVLEVFPAVKSIGLFEVFQRVWRTGEPEHHPMTLYRDERITEWVENYVFKLPSGDIVAVYNDVTEYKRAEEALRNMSRSSRPP